MSNNTEVEERTIATGSEVKEHKTETHIGLIKKEVDEDEHPNESDVNELLAKDKQKRENIEIKEELLIEYELKTDSPDIIEENSDIEEISNSETNVVAKPRHIRHDSVEIKEEFISDEDINQETIIDDKLKRQYGSEFGEDSSGIEIKKRRVNHNLEKRRQGGGEYYRLCAELSQHEERYHKYFRMSHEAFETLHDKLKPTITKMFSNYKTPISSRERLVVCLRYLSSGDSYGKIASSYHLGRSTVSKIVRETCIEIWNVLQPEYMPKPTRKIWEESERGFSDVWNFPNCVGCIDGKHVTIKYLNPKKPDNRHDKQSSIVFLTVIDPWCKFTAIDIGDYGVSTKMGIFEETEFYQTYIVGLRNVLPSKTLPGTTTIAPRVFLGNESFVLQPYLLRSFPTSAEKADEAKRKYNDRFKGPYSVVNKAFDVLIKRWSIFSRPLETDVDTATYIIKAACCLHNYVIKQGIVEDECLSVSEESKPKKKGRRKKPLKTFIAHKPSHRRWTALAANIRQMFVTHFSK